MSSDVSTPGHIVGHMQIGDCDAVELVRKHGSPLYVVDEQELRASITQWRSAMEKVWTSGPSRLLPSVKASLALAIQEIVRQSGCGADTFGPGEYEITRRAGFDPALVSVNGQKSTTLISRAIRDGARLTVDNLGELPEIRTAAESLGVTAKVRIRVRPPLVGWDEPSDLAMEEVPISTLMGIYKAGVPVHQLDELTFDDFGGSIELVGLHAHVARNTRDPEYWALASREVMALAARVRNRIPGWAPQEIDMGGGFPSSADTVGQSIDRVREKYESSPVPAVENYVSAVARGLREGATHHGFDLDGVLLEIEPGRGLFARSGYHLATVMRRKEQREPFEHSWVELDTSTVHFGVEEPNRWATIVASRCEEPATLTADIVGCSCQLDLMVSDARMPDVQVGDVVAFLDAGAYQEATASNFNALVRPAVVLVDGGRSELIRRRETIDDLLGRDLVPTRLTMGAVVN